MPKLQLFAAALCAALPMAAHSAPAPAPSSAPVATAPDPERLALAARVSAVLWPNGTYGRMFQSMISGDDGLLDMALDMRPADFLGAMAEGMGPLAEDPGTDEKGKGAADSRSAAKPPATPQSKPSPTLREVLLAEDPNFEERMRITAKVAGEELTRLAAPIEPKLRDGLTKSIARRFTRAQLGPIADFFETAPGKAYAAQSMSLYMDKDVLLAMATSVPAVIKEFPGIMEKVKKATAHLPKPKAKATEGADDSGGSSEEPADAPDELPST